MKNKISLFLIIISLIFVFIIFYKGLSKTTLYKPESRIQNIPEFTSVTFFKKEETNSKKIFNETDFYLLNIWASWCLPCRDEHEFLMELSKIQNVTIIGLNYKDNKDNAKSFIKEFGNPFDIILIDDKGLISIDIGAYGVPETYLINNFDKKIIKKYIGPIDNIKFKKIISLIKL